MRKPAADATGTVLTLPPLFYSAAGKKSGGLILSRTWGICGTAPHLEKAAGRNFCAVKHRGGRAKPALWALSSI